MRVEMLTGWQGGPASITVEGDELNLDDGTVGFGVILDIDTAADDDGDNTLEVGAHSIDAIVTRIRVSVACTHDQARELITALANAIAP